MANRRPLTSLAVGAVLAIGALVGCGDGDDAEAPPSSAELTPEARQGSTLAVDLGCGACHSIDGGRSTGPGWVGLAGSEVELEGGETVVADRAYLERSIRDPRSQVRAGYANIMPTTYELSDEEIDALIVFIEALSTG